MMQRYILAAFIGVLAAAMPIAAHAQNIAAEPAEPAELVNTAEILAELDQLAEAAAIEQNGLLLAQEQAQRGELLEALGTVERVLALHPKSQSARLLHAVYLCQIDDLPGGEAETGKLKEKNFTPELWSQARSICKLDGGKAP